MKDVRWVAALQIILAGMSTSLLPFLGLNGVVVVLSAANVCGGVAGLYGWKGSVPTPVPTSASTVR